MPGEYAVVLACARASPEHCVMSAGLLNLFPGCAHRLNGPLTPKQCTGQLDQIVRQTPPQNGQSTPSLGTGGRRLAIPKAPVSPGPCSAGARPLSEVQEEHTAFMSAPFCPVALDIATAVLSRLASDFARLTSWFEPNASFAGRFDWDILGSVRSRARDSSMGRGLRRAFGGSCL